MSVNSVMMSREARRTAAYLLEDRTLATRRRTRPARVDGGVGINDLFGSGHCAEKEMLEQRPDELRCEVLSGMDEFLDELVEGGGNGGRGDKNQR